MRDNRYTLSVKFSEVELRRGRAAPESADQGDQTPGARWTAEDLAFASSIPGVESVGGNSEEFFVKVCNDPSIAKAVATALSKHFAGAEVRWSSVGFGF